MSTQKKYLLKQIDGLKSISEKLSFLKPEINYQFNDRDYSRLFSEVVHSNLRYNVSLEKWMYYNGKYWEQDFGSTNTKRAMKEFSKALQFYSNSLDPTVYKEFIDFIAELGMAIRRNTLIKDSYDEFTVTADDFDRNPYLFNCGNGTIDLVTMTLYAHNPDDMITKYSPVIYDPNAKSNLLDNFMSQICCGDTDLVTYLYRMLGYSLSGLTKEECCFILLGESSRNGKSTLLSTFSTLLGDTDESGYVRDIDIQTLAQKKYLNGSAPSPDVAKLKDTRFVICSEPPEDFIMNEALLKSMTGRDKITARLLYKNEISFEPTFKIAMATNHRPYIQDDSVLESHRLRVIPFNYHFSQDEQDKDLKDKLKTPEVQSAFLFNCLNGYIDYKKHGLNEPKAVIDATARYQTATQILEMFMHDCLTKSSDGRIKLSDFYNSYSDWCEAKNILPQPKRKVASTLRSRGLVLSTATINGKTVRNVVCGYIFCTVATEAMAAYSQPAVNVPAEPELSPSISSDNFFSFFNMDLGIDSQNS